MADELGTFAKRLKVARRAAKLTQEQLGIAAEIDEFSASARMNQYEKGKHWPDYGTSCRIAKSLKLDTAYFYAKSDTVAELLFAWSKASPAVRKRALQELLSS